MILSLILAVLASLVLGWWLCWKWLYQRWLSHEAAHEELRRIVHATEPYQPPPQVPRGPKGGAWRKGRAT